MESLCELCLAPNLGGLELYFLRCAKHFAVKGSNNWAIVGEGSRLAAELGATSGQYIAIPAKNDWRAARKLSKQIHAFLSQKNIQLIHVHHKQDLLVAALVKRRSKGKIKLIFTRQMLMPHSKKDPYHTWLYGQFDHIIAITDQLRNDMQEKINIDPERISRLYYGVEVEHATPEEIESFRSALPGRADVKIGVFSRIDPLKGQHTVLEAMHHLQTEKIIADVHFFGDLMEARYQEKLDCMIASAKLENQVFFHGFLKRPSRYMPAFDMVIMPSLKETFGLVAAEAQLQGVPVIGAATGGINEIITRGQTGWLFQPGVAEELTSQLKEAIANPGLRETYARQAQKMAKERFDEKSHFNKLTQLMTSVLP